MFTIYNYSDAAEGLTLTIHFDGGSYKLPIHLDAGASTMLGMEDIMARQTPDADGNTIPPGVTEGSAKLSGSRGELQHIQATVSVASYNPSKATCFMRCIDCSVTLYIEFAPAPAFASITMGKTQQMEIVGTTRGGTQYNTTANGLWTASNPKVATVGTGATQPGLVTATGVGAASVTYGSPPIQVTEVACGDPPECPASVQTVVVVPTDVGQLSCTSVTRGDNTTCTGTGPTGTTWTDWQFTDGTSTVSESTGSTAATWSGTAVASGTVSATATFPDGSTTSYSATLTVSPRTGWAYSPQPSTRVAAISPANCSSVPVVPATPIPSLNDGEACVYVAYSGYTSATVSTGPNTGYGYLATEPADLGSFTWTISSDIDNPSSTFYQAQCGNYNALTNRNGFISGIALDIDTQRHEGGLVNGHYGNYVAALQIPANNLGMRFESTISGPGLDLSSYVQQVFATVSTAVQEYGGEPCGTHDTNFNAACASDGNVNFAPYQKCQ